MFRVAARIAAAAAMVSVASCALEPVDQFSGRSLQYNLQAENSQDQTLLLNIARASMRRPLEFTGLQTVSGTASLSGGAQWAFPFSHGPRFTSQTGGLNGSFSGGPTFAVNVLDTQEFFQGIMKPIEQTTVDFYNQELYSRTALFNLLISRIVIRQGQKVLELDNYVGDDYDLDRFQLVLDYLIDAGLTTQIREKKTPFGAFLTPEEARDVGAAARAATAKLDLDEIAWCDLAKDEDELRRGLTQFKHPEYDIRLQNWCEAKGRAEEKAKQEVRVPQPTAAAASFGGPAYLCSNEKPNSGSGLSPVTKKKFAECFPGLPPFLYRVDKTEKEAEFCFERLGLDRATELRSDALKLMDGPRGCPKDKSAGAEATNSTTASPPSGSGNATAGPSRGNGPQSPGAEKPGSEKYVILGSRLGEVLKELAEKSCLAGAPSTERKCDLPSAGIDFAIPVDSLDFFPRSTEGVIYYLGEVVRRQLYPDQLKDEPVPPRVVMIKYGWLPGQIPLTGGTCPNQPVQHDSQRCEPLFKISDGTVSGSSVAVDYNGQHFALPEDNDRHTRETTVGRTYQVLDVVTQLLALHKSAKDLPVTSVFTVITPP